MVRMVWSVFGLDLIQLIRGYSNSNAMLYNRRLIAQTKNIYGKRRANPVALL